MRVVYDSGFIGKLKKANIRIRKNFQNRIDIFSKDPTNPQLKNHPLKEKYQGYRSIDITSDWRAIYKEVRIGVNTVAYFIALGTHKELYGS